MIVNDKKLHLLIEMINFVANCNDVYFNWYGERCRYQLDCNEKCPFYNVENMMKWVK